MENRPRKHRSALKKGISPWPAVENPLSGSRLADVCRGRRGPLASRNLTSEFDQIDAYLRHVEETGGYDVGVPFDRSLIDNHCLPLGPINTLKARQPLSYKYHVRRPTRFAIKKINADEGYDVGLPFDRSLIDDHCRPLGPINTLEARQPLSYKYRVRRPTRFAIKKINADEGCNYKLVEILNAVHSRCQKVFLTFTVKDDAANSVETIQVIVDVPYGSRCGPYEIVEWRIKPDYA